MKEEGSFDTSQSEPNQVADSASIACRDDRSVFVGGIEFSGDVIAYWESQGWMIGEIQLDSSSPEGLQPEAVSPDQIKE